MHLSRASRGRRLLSRAKSLMLLVSRHPARFQYTHVRARESNTTRCISCTAHKVKSDAGQRNISNINDLALDKSYRLRDRRDSSEAAL